MHHSKVKYILETQQNKNICIRVKNVSSDPNIQNTPKQTKGEVSQAQESVCFFLLNQAALDHDCFSLNGCYGYKNGGYSRDKFLFPYIGKLCAYKQRIFIVIAEYCRHTI